MRVINFYKNLQYKNIIHELVRIINKTFFSKYIRKLVDILNKKEINKRIISIKENDFEIINISRMLQKYKWVEIPSEWIKHEIFELDKQLNIEIKMEKTPELAKNKKEEIWEYLFDSNQYEGKINETNPLVKIALNKKLNYVVSEYLGQIPWLRYTLITKSVYSSKDYDYSQKWHLDFDDEKMLKLFVYMSDVESIEYGPFQFINLETSLKVKNNIIRKHLRDSEMNQTEINDGKVIMLGKKTKAFLVDTHRLYHCGSRLSEGRSRILYTALFTAYPSIYPGVRNGFTVSENGNDYQKSILTPI